jgi:phage-related protein
MQPNAARNTPLSKPSKVSAGERCLRSWRRMNRNTYRAVYTVRFFGAIYVLHAFQKKSKRGIATPQKEIELVNQRLAAAEQDYGERQN